MVLKIEKDSDIHENPTEVRLDALISRMIRGARLAGHEVLFSESGLTVTANRWRNGVGLGLCATIVLPALLKNSQRRTGLASQ